MIILPAIDLKDGQCVRLFKGDFNTVHQVSEDPLATAQAFFEAGAEMIHMVDLDGALNGVRKNSFIVRQIADQSGLKIELGGGIRSMEDLAAADTMGVYRMVIGSMAVESPPFVKQAVAKYGERIAVSIDAKDGFVKTSGWTKCSRLNYLDFAKAMEKLGVQTIIFTDIDTDGTLCGPAMDKLLVLKHETNCFIIASGGISDIEDIKKLKAANLDGAIIGKAYYAGTIDLKEAIKEAKT